MSAMNSTIDWCEANYIVTPLIAEFWNTVSGLAIILSGYLFKRNQLNHTLSNSKQAITRLKNVSTLLYFVGVGTMLFHGTLLYPFQLLDELPMIMVSLEYIVALMSLSIVKANVAITPYVGTITKTVGHVKAMMVVISLVYFIHPLLQIMSFHVTVKVCETTLLYILYNMNSHLNAIVYTSINNKHVFRMSAQHTSMNASTLMFSMYTRAKDSGKLEALKASQDDLKSYLHLRKELQKHTWYGLYLYGTSVGIWVLENLFCEYTRWLQLHAFWHVLSSLGIYHLSSMILTHARINDLCN